MMQCDDDDDDEDDALTVDWMIVAQADGRTVCLVSLIIWH